MEGQPWQAVTTKIRLRDLLSFMVVGTYLGFVMLFLLITRRLPLQFELLGKMMRYSRGAARRVVRLFKRAPDSPQQRKAA